MSRLGSAAFPAIATLIAEDHAAEGGALWCCPLCGGLNAADDPQEPFASEGWCQHDGCVQRRDVRSSFSWLCQKPEILFASERHVAERRPEVFA